MLSRRDFVGKIAAASAIGLGVGIAKPAAAAVALKVSAPDGVPDVAPASPPAAPSATGESVLFEGVDAQTAIPAAPWYLLRPWAIGTVVGHGWRVAALSPIVDGACVLTLRNARGRSQRVHLCRNDGRPQGLVYTRRFDLVVMNGGRGDLPTEEGFAQAVGEVAHVIAANEAERENYFSAVSLLTHAERTRLFAGPADGRLR